MLATPGISPQYRVDPREREVDHLRQVSRYRYATVARTCRHVMVASTMVVVAIVTVAVAIEVVSAVLVVMVVALAVFLVVAATWW